MPRPELTRPLSRAAVISLWILEGGSALMLSVCAAVLNFPRALEHFAPAAAWCLIVAGTLLLGVALAFLIRAVFTRLPLRARTIAGLLLFAGLLMALVVPTVQTVLMRS